MSSDNKWKQPDSPPPPLFIGKKERDLIKQVNDELIERVIGQEDQDLYVRAGDFVNYGGIFYEIVDWAEPRKIYGQVDHSIEVSAKCVRARPGVFDGT